jgi:hypothetical protein
MCCNLRMNTEKMNQLLRQGKVKYLLISKGKVMREDSGLSGVRTTGGMRG